MRILLFMRSLRVLFFLLALFSFGKSYVVVAQEELAEEIADAPDEQETVEAEEYDEEAAVDSEGEEVTEDEGASIEEEGEAQEDVANEEEIIEEDEEIQEETPESEVADESDEQEIADEEVSTDSEGEEETAEEVTEDEEEEAQEEVEEPEEQEPDVIEIKGIDTLDIDEPKGNWLLKRIWWEKAERWYEKIKQVKQEVLESRMFFFQKRTELDRNTFDPFYIKVGVGQGELQEIISSLLAMLEKMREEQGSLDEQQREFLVTLELEQETLKNLEQKLKSINAVDNGIDDALMKLMEQINRAREYERQAWDTFKTITRELSDKRARELYYSMDGMWKNVGAISSYIKEQFAPYFNQMIEKAQGLIVEMESAIALLKEKGIDLKSQAQELSKQGGDRKKQQLEQENKQASKREKTQNESGQSSWFGWLYDLLNMVTDGFGAMWDYIISFFVAAPAIEPAAQEAQG